MPLSEDLEIVDEASLKIEVDDSHKLLIRCGGYVGCEACGRFSSTNTERNRLRHKCRATCPAGSLGAVKRMKGGEHPLGNLSNGAKRKWPNGEEQPSPVRVKHNG